MATLREFIETAADESSSHSSSGPSNAQDHTSSSFNTSTNTTTNNKDSTQTSESSTLAKAETRAVNRTKLLVLAVLSIAAMGVGFATYWFTRQSETHEFENKVGLNGRFCVDTGMPAHLMINIVSDIVP